MKLYIPSNNFGVSASDLVCPNMSNVNGTHMWTTYKQQSPGSVYYDTYYIYYDNTLGDYNLYKGSRTQLPSICNNWDVTLSDDYLSRKDVADILLSFFIILIICIYFPYRIISRCFGRWLKV